MKSVKSVDASSKYAQAAADPNLNVDQFRNIGGNILSVAIQGDDYGGGGFLQARVEGGRLASVAGHMDHLTSRATTEPNRQHGRGTIRPAVIHEDILPAGFGFLLHVFQFGQQGFYIPAFIEKGNDGTGTSLPGHGRSARR